jgi:hypothetical protein
VAANCQPEAVWVLEAKGVQGSGLKAPTSNIQPPEKLQASSSNVRADVILVVLVLDIFLFVVNWPQKRGDAEAEQMSNREIPGIRERRKTGVRLTQRRKGAGIFISKTGFDWLGLGFNWVLTAPQWVITGFVRGSFGFVRRAIFAKKPMNTGERWLRFCQKNFSPAETGNKPLRRGDAEEEQIANREIPGIRERRKTGARLTQRRKDAKAIQTGRACGASGC